MPIVHIYVWKGLSDEAKSKIIEGITEVFESLGIPKEAVEIMIIEVPKDNWGIGGVKASEKFRDINPP